MISLDEVYYYRPVVDIYLLTIGIGFDKIREWEDL